MKWHIVFEGEVTETKKESFFKKSSAYEAYFNQSCQCLCLIRDYQACTNEGPSYFIKC